MVSSSVIFVLDFRFNSVVFGSMEIVASEVFFFFFFFFFSREI